MKNTKINMHALQMSAQSFITFGGGKGTRQVEITRDCGHVDSAFLSYSTPTAKIGMEVCC